MENDKEINQNIQESKEDIEKIKNFYEGVDFNDYHLQDLRQFASLLGVKAPTRYTKTDLVFKIRELLNGETQPSFSKRGRPKIKKMDLIQDQQEDLFSKIRVFIQDQKEEKHQKKEQEKISFDKKKLMEIANSFSEIQKTIMSSTKILVDYIEQVKDQIKNLL